MTPQEKARELVHKFHKTCNASIAGASTIFKSIAKQCAIIAVDEIINTGLLSYKESDNSFLQPTTQPFWQSIKTEINKL